MLQYPNFYLLDGARLVEKLTAAKRNNPNYACLYARPPAASAKSNGSLAIEEIAPHLFSYALHTSFGRWATTGGWGKSWGIMLRSGAPVEALVGHFRRFLMIKTESGKSLYFRFYDPRVLRVFLPTCDAAQIREFFGNAIDYFVCEDEDPDYALRFSHQNGVLKTERFSVKEEIAALPEPEPLLPPEEEPLPPETIAYLKEQGIVLPDTNNANTSVTNLDRAAPAAKPATDVQPSPPPQTKTKWNMFD